MPAVSPLFLSGRQNFPGFHTVDVYEIVFPEVAHMAFSSCQGGWDFGAKDIPDWLK